MERKVPVVATVVVLLAVATMVALGVWQLQRLHWKETLLAHYSAASADPAPVEYPVASQAAADAALYRRSTIECAFTGSDWRSIAGRSSEGRSGYVHIILCGIDRGSPGEDRTAYVQAGWSPGPTPPDWTGGPVSGRIAPYSEGFMRLVADPPLGGLAASAEPDPNDISNNHLAYAVQWFLFALTALVIYALALRRKWRGG
ncbi:SURF1 family protein [Altererythrobacter salegens]|uniref:SURF1-like protein n=1 Tax=Croceibacterium salegens TaxID=1737568 RepID=A0A6I4SWA1_9SPHN|nr:SURF1 family protein [Croceibacterium salegens]MXO60281.1 SURF1 family protein [Croceibacterium salegens]